MASSNLITEQIWNKKYVPHFSAPAPRTRAGELENGPRAKRVPVPVPRAIVPVPSACERCPWDSSKMISWPNGQETNKKERICNPGHTQTRHVYHTCHGMHATRAIWIFEIAEQILPHNKTKIIVETSFNICGRIQTLPLHPQEF